MVAKPGIALALLGGVSVVVWLALGKNDVATVGAWIADVEQRTVLPSSQRLAAASIERKADFVTATWDVESEQSWADYSLGVDAALHGGGFDAAARHDATIVYRKRLPGDTLRVTLERTSDQPLRVRVTFVVYPS